MTTLFPFRRTRIAAAVGSLGLSLAAGQALGAGFALQEQNASGLGHAYAGGAAAAEDVSTIYLQPGRPRAAGNCASRRGRQPHLPVGKIQ